MKYRMWNIFGFSSHFSHFVDSQFTTHWYTLTPTHTDINIEEVLSKQWNIFQIAVGMCISASFKSILCKIRKMLSSNQAWIRFVFVMYCAISSLSLAISLCLFISDSMSFFTLCLYIFFLFQFPTILWTVCRWHVMPSFTFDTIYLVSVFLAILLLNRYNDKPNKMTYTNKKNAKNFVDLTTKQWKSGNKSHSLLDALNWSRYVSHASLFAECFTPSPHSSRSFIFSPFAIVM